MPKLYWINQSEMFVSDGHTANTVGGFHIGSPYSSPDWTQFGNHIAFVGVQNTRQGDDIWVTDGTNLGTREITIGFEASSLNSVGDFIVFNQNGSLWSFDDNLLTGAQAIASLQGVTPIVPTTSGGFIGVFSNGKYAVFDGSDANGKVGLWVTDGTSAGSSEIVPGNQNGHSYSAQNFINFGDEVLFTAVDRNGNRGVWITDGTMAGTTELVSGNFGGFVENSEMKAVFVGSTSTQSGLWVTDGTVAGTKEVVANQQGSYSLSPQNITALYSGWVFEGTDSSGKKGLWETFGEADDGFEVLAGAQGAYSLAPSSFVDWDGLLFVGTDAKGGRGVWLSNEFVGTIELVSGLQGSYNLNPTDFTTVALGHEYFAATDAGGYAGVWRTDGTAEGTSEVVSGQQFTQSLDPFDLTPFGSQLAFLGTDGNGNVGVWVTDGTTTTEILAGKQGAYVLSPDFLAVVGTSLLFSGTDAAGADVEWTSDGTPTGTKMIAPSGSTDPYSLGDTQFLEWTFAPSNFNGDGNSDILFQNTKGIFATWQMNGSVIAGGGTVQIPYSNYMVVGISEVDDYASIVIEQMDTRAIDILVMFGSSVTTSYQYGQLTGSWEVVAAGDFDYKNGGSKFLYRDAIGDLSADLDFPVMGNPGRGWTYVGDGDFNGDGSTDLLFENTQGTYATWLVNNFAISGGATLGTPGQGWVMKGIGYNAGDSTNTVVFLNEDTGMVATWKIKNDAITGGGDIAALGPQWAIKSVGDYNGDGYSDILFYNVSSGQYATWELNATASGILAGGTLGAPGYNWSVQGLAPAAQRELPGIIFFQNTAGSIAAWNVEGGVNAGGPLLGSPGGTWSFLAAGDFNGDLEPDLLFRDASGNYATWQTNGVKQIGGGNIGNPGGTWSYVGLGDFNGDGTSDILFKDAGGNYASWDLHGTSIIGGATIGNPGAGWTFAAIGDFNGDGSSDILFEKGGTYATWEVGGNQIVGGGTIGAPGGTWALQGVGDFNGDGRSDMLFKDASGNYATWDISNTSIVGGGTLGNLGSQWAYAGIADIFGNHLDSILFYNASTTSYATWDLTDNAIRSVSNIGSTGAGWTEKAFV